MKTQVFTLIAAAVLITVAACTRDDNGARDNTPVAARITASMDDVAVATPAAKAGQPATRAVNDRWNRDHIGVMVISSPNSDMTTRYCNAHYTTASTAASADFTPADADNTIYFADADETVAFLAYAPYQPSATAAELPGADGTIIIDATRQTTAEEQEAVDFIVAWDATASKAEPTVRFTKVDDAHDYAFHHIMSRLVLKIETPAAYGFDPADVERISAITLGGLCTGGFLDVKPDPVTGAPFSLGYVHDTWKAEWDIAAYVHTVAPGKDGATQRTHTLIVPPMQFPSDINGNNLSAVPIAITLDGQVYTNNKDITLDGVVFAQFSSGVSYEYTIRLRRAGLEVTGATITPWTDGGGTIGDATRQ